MSWLNNLAKGVRDIFDANTKEDQRKRLAAGQPRYYQQQQQAIQNYNVAKASGKPTTYTPPRDLGSFVNQSVFKPISENFQAVTKMPNDVYNSPVGRGVRATVNLTPLAVGNLLHNDYVSNAARNSIASNLSQIKPGLDKGAGQYVESAKTGMIFGETTGPLKGNRPGMVEPTPLRPKVSPVETPKVTEVPPMIKKTSLPEPKPGDALYISPAEKATMRTTETTPKYSGGPLPVAKPQAKASAPPGVGTIPLEQLGKRITVEPRDVTGKVMKDPAVKSVFDNLSIAERNARSEQGLTAAAIERAAKVNKINTADLNVWERYQRGTPQTPAETNFFNAIKKETDRIFQTQRKVDPSIPYRQNYLPGEYAGGPQAFENAIKQLQTKTKSAERKTFNTYGEAQQFGLQPKYKTIQETLASNAGQAERAMYRKRAVEAGLQDGIFDTKPANRNWKQVDGLYTPQGDPIFASSTVADRINGATQIPTETVGKVLQKAATASSALQQTALTGGVPNSWFNAFGLSQGNLQVAGYLRPSAFRDMYYGSTKGLTQERFTRPTSVAKGLTTPEFVRAVEGKGGNIGQISSDASTMSQGLGRRVANKASGEQATFQQLVPNFNLSIAEATYKKYVKKVGHEEALKIAADTVNRTQGFTDVMAKGRSVNTQNATTTVAFAPRYREAVYNQLSNALKAWKPSNFKDPSFRYSRRFIPGLVATAAVYDAANVHLNGHHMWENRNGQELSLQIPIGPKDEKGNQPVVNIPLFPSTLTIPRAVVNSVIASVRVAKGEGDIGDVAKEAGKVLSTPLQVGNQILTNRDYFDRPIYNDKETAALQGVEPDNIAEIVGKEGIYAAKQLLPGWGRAALDKVGVGRDEPASWGQTLAQATEAPVRFGKQLNPNTEAYFNDRDQIYKSLNANDRAVWDSIHPPVQKNVNGDYITDKSVWSGSARAANYLNNDAVLKAENEMARRAKARGQKVDPLFGDLKGQQQQIALVIDTLPPKDPNKTVLKQQNPWYDQYYKTRQAFFDSLPPGDPNKPESPIAFPEPDTKTANLQDAYYQIKDPKMKRDFLDRNPEVTEQMAKEEQYSRAVRAAKNLPQYDQFPQASPKVQKLIDTYSALPKGEANGKSRIRSAWIKAHPNEWQQMTDQFSKQAQYNLQRDASLASFEGVDMTDKGIKAIKDLAKSLGMSDSSGGFGGYKRRGGGGGAGSGTKGLEFDGIISGVSKLNKKVSSAKVGKASLSNKVAKPKLKKLTVKRNKS